MLENNNACPICKASSNNKEIIALELYQIDCPRCGRYEILDNVLPMFQKNNLEDKVLAVSYWIRQHQSESGCIRINLSRMRELLVPFVPPKPREQADNLIIWMGNNLSIPDKEIVTSSEYLTSVIGSHDASGVKYITNFLIEENLILKDGETSLISKVFKAKLTFKGWDRYYELQHSNKDSRLAFMAMKFGTEPLDTLYTTITKDAVEKTGFELRKLDEDFKPGLIDDKLRVQIRRSKFLIADLTHDNNGAYWEAGYAAGLGLPVIYICKEEKFKDKNKTTHFDTNHHLTLTWKEDKSDWKEFAGKLKNTIRAEFPAEAKMED